MTQTPLWLEAIKAVAPLGTLAVAIWAAYTWRRTLRNQRADECIGAAHEMYAAIEYTMRLKEAEKPDERKTQEAYNHAWEVSWRRFDAAYAVARRYHPSLPADTTDHVFELLSDVGKSTAETLRQTIARVYDERVHGKTPRESYKQKAKEIVAEIEGKLGPKQSRLLAAVISIVK